MLLSLLCAVLVSIVKYSSENETWQHAHSGVSGARSKNVWMLSEWRMSFLGNCLGQNLMGIWNVHYLKNEYLRTWSLTLKMFYIIISNVFFAAELIINSFLSGENNANTAIIHKPKCRFPTIVWMLSFSSSSECDKPGCLTAQSSCL